MYIIKNEKYKACLSFSPKNKDPQTKNCLVLELHNKIKSYPFISVSAYMLLGHKKQKLENTIKNTFCIEYQN